MAANISSRTIAIGSSAVAALAYLFVLPPLPSDSAIEAPAQVILGPASGGPLEKPSVSAPVLRTLELPLTEPHLGAEEIPELVTAADDPETMLPQATPSVGAPAVPAAATLPQVSATGVPSAASSVEEFPGAVPVSVPRLAANPKWRRIIEENPQKLRIVDCAGTTAECASSPWARWNDLVLKVSALQGEERLQAVNEGVNALLTYASDDDIYGVGDYWATLEESMARGRGDCEDIAIAKMWLLKAAGMDLSSMRLVVLKDTLRNLDHAVLSVVENGHQYVLDNTAWKVGRADWMRGYRPIYALSANQSWIYGMRVPAAPPLQVAQNAGASLAQ